MNIGMVCYASVGGSGVVATELAHALAGRGHQVHLISSDPPFRWRSGVAGLTFNPVEVPPYPLFREPQYLLALVNTIARVAEERRLDIVHAHYAVPHATAAYLADQMLAATPSFACPRMVTTLHGTDITLIGSDPSYTRVVAFSIEQSHAVTAVSSSLRSDTIGALGISREIRVIPNFLDCATYRRRHDPLLAGRLLDFGRPPILSGFVLVGGVAAALAFRSKLPRRLLALAGLWLAMFFGRVTWGRLLLLAAVPADLHLHRLQAVFELSASLLAAWGVVEAVRRLARYGRAP